MRWRELWVLVDGLLKQLRSRLETALENDMGQYRPQFLGAIQTDLAPRRGRAGTLSHCPAAGIAIVNIAATATSEPVLGFIVASKAGYLLAHVGHAH